MKCCQLLSMSLFLCPKHTPFTCTCCCCGVQDPSGIVEKQELVSTVARLAAAGPQGESAALPPTSATPPAGYTWDAAAGYFHSPATGLYWDAATGGYYNPADSKWYAWDAAAAQYVPWT
jgi:hypothetical protein